MALASIYDILSPLIDVFEAVLKFFHNSLGVPWGWAIVLLTVCVRAVLVPLTFKQMGSMARMQQLQPQMKEIQSKYKDDKQRQQQEMMKFYRENNVNPLGSCLPLVAQLPVFVSLYYMLRESLRNDICPHIQQLHQQAYALKHHISVAAASNQTVACGAHGGSHGASFLFIGDLTNKATGITLVILIVLYVGSQLSSSLMMSSATMDKTQRQIMLFMPVIFVLFVIQFPAGVLVYWITTNIWTIGQQYVIKRRIGPIQAAAAAASAAAAGTAGAASDGKPEPAGAQAKSSRPRAGQRQTGRSGGNGADGESSTASGGLGRLIGKAKPPEETPKEKRKVATGARSGGPPPKPPRKKKKRSGRRR